ncbi:MAG: hypothetical protein QGI09_10810 [Dehalococcoidia bacterium]|nr:hypothetical protein [Dehalococcoidia bacterium]
MPASVTTVRPEAPRISLRDNWWIAIPIVALIVALESDPLWMLLYVHVFTAILWTGTDIFMGFILGPIMRRVDFDTRRAIITRLMPRMIFYMPTMAGVTGAAGYYLADRLGYMDLPYPEKYWVVAALVMLGIMTVQGFGILLPTNLMVYLEMRKEQPDGAKIKRLMSLYVRVVASQAVTQFSMVFIMVKFRTGLSF